MEPLKIDDINKPNPIKRIVMPRLMKNGTKRDSRVWKSK